MIKLNVYEYLIKDKVTGNYTGSYTVKAGCPNEETLKIKHHAKKVDTINFPYGK
jgi:hypothetical protein